MCLIVIIHSHLAKSMRVIPGFGLSWTPVIYDGRSDTIRKRYHNRQLQPFGTVKGSAQKWMTV